MESPSPVIEKHLLVIGGGISGLSAAYYAVIAARERGFPLRVSVVEADSRWGGKITTERVWLEGGQFIIEGGPDTFLATKPWAVSLCKQLGLQDRLHGTNPYQKNTYILHRGQLLPLPDGLAMMVPTNIGSVLRSGLISWAGKARMSLDFVIPPAHPNGDESLGAFISRRLGREAYENLIEPLMSGIYAGDGDMLSLASTFPYLRELELKYGSLAWGALQMRRKVPARSIQGSRSAFLTPTTGLLEIVEALVTVLLDRSTDLRLNTRVLSITKQGSRYQAILQYGDILPADAVILACPSQVSGSIVTELDADLAKVLQGIPYASTATLSLVYHAKDVPRKLDGYGYVIPRSEGRQALACTWTSTKFPHRAPDQYALLRIFIGRAGQAEAPPMDPSALLAIARDELRYSMGILVEPIISRTFIWENSMPQYNLGHPEKMRRIAARLDTHDGLALAGNGYGGIGIPDCIHSGQLALETLSPYLFGQKIAVHP